MKKKHFLILITILNIWTLHLVGCQSTPNTIEPETAIPTNTPTPNKEINPPTSTPNQPTITPSAIQTENPNPTIDPSKISFSASPFTIDNEDGGDQVSSVAFSPDSKSAAMAGKGIISIINMKTLTVSQKLDGHTDVVSGMAWTPDGLLLITASLDGTTILWDGETYSQLAVLHTGIVTSLDISSDGSHFVVGTPEGEVLIWDVKNQELILTLNNPTNTQINDVSWSPNGTTIASGDSMGIIYLWDAGTGNLLKTLNNNSNELSSANSVDWSADGNLLASGHENGLVHIWETKDWTTYLSFEAHDGRVSSVAWMPTAEVIATSGEDFNTAVWDGRTGTKITGATAWSPLICLAWSPNAKMLAFGNIVLQGKENTIQKGWLNIWIRTDNQ